MDVLQHRDLTVEEDGVSSLTDLVRDIVYFHSNPVEKNIYQPDRMIMYCFSVTEVTLLSWKRHNVVEFRNLKAKDEVFFLEFEERDPYDAVVGRVAQKLCVDRLKIRLTRQFSSLDKPNSDHIECLFAGCLLDMVPKSEKICNVLYYEVIDVGKELNVSYGYPYVKISVVLPRHGRVDDLLNDIKHKVKLTNSDAELRLFGIYKHKLYKQFDVDDKIEDIPEETNLRVEEVLEKNLGCGHHMISVYHSIGMLEGAAFGFGEPFLFIIREDETLAEVKVRIQRKLSVDNEEFSKWKFTLLRLGGRPRYLKDTDVVYSCFEGNDDVLAQYFGVEHIRELDDDFLHLMI